MIGLPREGVGLFLAGGEFGGLRRSAIRPFFLRSLLRNRGIFPADKHRRTALHVACRQGHEEIVRYLLKDAFANPNAQDKDEATPLIHSIQVWTMESHGTSTYLVTV